MNIIGIFPTPIGVVDLPRKLTEDELNFMKVQNVRYNEGNLTSVNNYILNTIELADLRYMIWEHVQAFFDNVFKPKYLNRLRITQSWLNFNPNTMYHHLHAHPNSILSGVFYPEGSETHGEILFHKNSYQQLIFESNENNDFNSHSYHIPATTNRLIIFPSSLSHSVKPFESPTTRISLSFNTFATGVFGEGVMLTELIL